MCAAAAIDEDVTEAEAEGDADDAVSDSADEGRPCKKTASVKVGLSAKCVENGK